MGDSDFDDDELFKDLYGEEKESKPEIPAKNEQLEKESGAGESEEAATDGKNAEDSREEKQSIPSPQPRSVDATSTGDDSYGARQSAEPTAPVEAPQERQHTEQKPAAQEEQQSPFNREDGKMFIGGLNWETTDESLRDYFEQFGEVLDCTVMRDSTTGRSRGFGFLTFKDPKCVQVVMSKEHHLDGKIIDPKRAIPREEQEKTAKMFVGGVPADCTEEEFRDFFNQFGRVLDATLMMDKDTGRPRGFGFVTFENEAAVENTMSQPYITIHGKPVEVKRATPKASMRDQHDRHQQMPGSYGQGNQYFAQKYEHVWRHDALP
ncbi:mRNA cleavage factor complex subunit [Schizosaccharomyces japonicus yFS275]|uniref:mRNA cleavage factor complex subunit n=1 Tax=Schizosaccharomyces japonicus (strain yFS275 / FY16936) TaxID=402676 RepID=B6K584_SCHJY|nr:mRNA cleavage factor complex subunit [Schizosaccharomyces japonicus yFS275]EEB08688.2 mRNA cleavage factor complex subunit [Schizosaccharomyces japonicus yFS275]